MTYVLIGVWTLVRVAFFAFAVWALVSALLRKPDEFALAHGSHAFWLTTLVICVLFELADVTRGLSGGFPGVLTWLVLYALIYYMGPEEQRMGPRARRSGRDSGSAWR